MSTLTVGKSLRYRTVTAALDEAQDGDTIMVDPGDYLDQPFLIKQSGLSIICPGGLQNPAKFGMTLRPHTNKAGKTHDWASIDKGICTIRLRARDFYIEGFEFFNAKIGSTYNGAGIRGQGNGLIVNKCIFHDNQNGILTHAQFVGDQGGLWIDPNSERRRTLAGHAIVTNSTFFDNGDNGGLAHDVYCGPAAFQIVAHNNAKNCLAGHHFKFNMGGGIALCYDNETPDDEEAETSCSADFDSGHALLLQNRMRKVNVTNPKSQANESKQIEMRNNREDAPLGNSFTAVDNFLESTVHKRGFFIRVDVAKAIKGDKTGIVPKPITGLIDRNTLCARRYMKQGANGETVKDGVTYLDSPIRAPDTMQIGNNTVIAMDGSPIVTPAVPRASAFSRDSWRADTKAMLSAYRPELLPVMDKLISE